MTWFECPDDEHRPWHTTRRPGFPWTIGIRHGEPDPFRYIIHARTAVEAVQVVARMRATGRGATIMAVAE